MTLVSKELPSRKKQKTKNFALDQGDDFASLVDLDLYSEYLIKRKALITEVKVKGLKLGLINLHLSPYSTDPDQNRLLRMEQATQVCNFVQSKGKKWSLTIIGMDMNDFPSQNGTMNPVYETFKGCGFVDAYNPMEK